MKDDAQQDADVVAIASLVDEIQATEAAVRDGAALSGADRVALGAAKKLVQTVRHHAEETEDTALEDRSQDFTEHAFEHETQIGGFR